MLFFKIAVFCPLLCRGSPLLPDQVLSRIGAPPRAGTSRPRVMGRKGDVEISLLEDDQPCGGRKEYVGEYLRFVVRDTAFVPEWMHTSTNVRVLVPESKMAIPHHSCRRTLQANEFFFSGGWQRPSHRACVRTIAGRPPPSLIHLLVVQQFLHHSMMRPTPPPSHHLLPPVPSNFPRPPVRTLTSVHAIACTSMQRHP